MIDVFWKASRKEVFELFQSMTEDQANRFFDEYIRSADQRLFLLNRAYLSWDEGSEDDLDFDPDGLHKLWRWAATRMLPRDFTRPERDCIESLPKWSREIKLQHQPLTEDALILVNDLAFYLAEVLIRTFKGVRWGILRTNMKRVRYENEPVLLGFTIPINPRESIRVAAVAQANGRPRDALWEIYETCYGLTVTGGGQ